MPMRGAYNVFLRFNRLIMMDKFQLEQKIVEMIKTVYDPEIPVIYTTSDLYTV